MSMILCLKRISDADIARLMATPAGVHAFIDAEQVEPDHGPEYAKALAELKAQMAAAGGMPPPTLAMTFGTYPFNDVFDVDKMWHGLYSCLPARTMAAERRSTSSFTRRRSGMKM